MNKWKLEKINSISDSLLFKEPANEKDLSIFLGTGLAADSVDDFLFHFTMKDEIVNNTSVALELLEAFESSEDIYKDFDIHFDRFFKTGKEDTDLKMMSIYERLYLRFIRSRYASSLNSNVPKKWKLSERFTPNLDLNLGVVQINGKDNRNSLDIASNTKLHVLCSNKEFSEYTHAVSIALHSMSDGLARTILIRYLFGKVERMFRITKEDPTFIIGRRNIAFVYLNHVRNALAVEFEKTQSQRIQFHELVGKSGIGKSSAIDNFANIISAMLPIIPRDDLIYCRANDYWWNGYCGQPIVLYDDFTHIKKKMKFDLHFELIAVASGKFRNPPMAFDKDTKFTSSIGFITSNIPVITTVSEPATIAALKRRINSCQWRSRNGLFRENGDLAFRGVLLNSIVSARSLFSLMSETLKISLERSFFIFELVPEVDKSGLDSFESPSTMLTSSVPESYSAPIVEGVVSEETYGFGDSTLVESAQVNHETPTSLIDEEILRRLMMEHECN